MLRKILLFFMNPIPHKNRSFNLLLFGQTMSQLGTSYYVIFLVLFLNEIIYSSSLVGFFLVLSMLPGIFLGPFCGVIVDRNSRKSLIVFSDIITGILVISFGFFIMYSMEDKVLLLALLAFIVLLKGFLWVIFQTAIYSVIPELVESRGVNSATGLLQGSMQMADLAGQILAGFLYPFFGLPFLMIINGLIFLISGVTESYVVIPHRQARDRMNYLGIGGVFRKDLREVKVYLAEKPGFLNLFLLFAMLEVLVSPLFILLPVYATDVLALDNGWYGYFMGTLTAGMFLGNALSIFLRFSSGSTGNVVTLFLFLYGFSFFVLGFVSSVALIVLDLLVIGTCVGFITVVLISSIQRNTLDYIRGRIVSCLNTVAMALGGISIGVSGIMVDFLSNNISVIFYIFGFLAVAISFVFFNSKGFWLLNKSDSSLPATFRR